MSYTKWISVLGPLVLLPTALMVLPGGFSQVSAAEDRGERRPERVLAGATDARRASNKSGSFVGSELFYEDLAPNEVTKHQHKYLREEILDGVPVWVIESTPRCKDSGYSRRELFVRQDTIRWPG